MMGILFSQPVYWDGIGVCLMAQVALEKLENVSIWLDDARLC